MNRLEIAKLMMIIEAEFQGRFKASEERAGVWLHVLEGIEYRDAEKGVVTALAACGQWPPSIGEIRNHAAAAMRERRREELRRSDELRMITNKPSPEVVEKGRGILREFLTKTGARRG